MFLAELVARMFHCLVVFHLMVHPQRGGRVIKMEALLMKSFQRNLMRVVLESTRRRSWLFGNQLLIVAEIKYGITR